jgi:hypothetical protein
MNVVQLDIDDKKQVRDFLRLPFEIYRDIPQWVPPLELDARAPFASRRFPFYRHSQAAFFLALRDEHPVGRIVALNNSRYNQHHQQHTGNFHWFECENRADAAEALFERALDWLRQRGLTQVVGPKGFSALEGGGILVKGFEHRPAFGMPYNPPYYPGFIEAAGFELTGESVSGYLSEGTHFPERIHELSQRVQARRGLHVARYRNRRDLRALTAQLQGLYNRSIGGTPDNVPITDDEAHALANQLLLFADPRLVKVVMKGNDPVGFLLAYPDISGALQKTRGRLFPFGWLTLWRERKRTDWLNINGAGLIEEYRGSGGMAILFSEMQKSITESGQFRHAEVVQIGVENDRMQREMENFGVDFYKRHRAYGRSL